MTKKQNPSRRENYDRLRKAGFSAKEAARVRDASPAVINKAIKIKKLPPVDIIKQAAGKGLKKETISPKKMTKFEKEKAGWQTRKRAAPKKKPKTYEIMGIPPTQVLKGKIEYMLMDKTRKQYAGRYIYVVAWLEELPGNIRKWEYGSFTSRIRLTKEQVFNEAKFWFSAGKGESIAGIRGYLRDGKPIIGSLVLVEAYYNPDWKIATW